MREGEGDGVSSARIVFFLIPGLARPLDDVALLSSSLLLSPSSRKFCSSGTGFFVTADPLSLGGGDFLRAAGNGERDLALLLVLDGDEVEAELRLVVFALVNARWVNCRS